MGHMERWNTMKVVRLEAVVKSKAALAAFHAPRYLDIAKNSTVPWPVVAAIHYRESDFNFRTHLHNGDPLDGRTFHVPAGRPVAAPKSGGVYTFEESAADALGMKSTIFPADGRWTVEATLEFLERYNGLGYRGLRRDPVTGVIRYSNNPTWTPCPIPSPYLWSFTNHYSKGKYVSDGHYDPAAVDQQIGAAPLLKAICDATRYNFVA